MTQICGINSSVPPTLRSICCVRLVLYCLRRLARVFRIWTLLGFLSFPSRQPSSSLPTLLARCPCLGWSGPTAPQCVFLFQCLFLFVTASFYFSRFYLLLCGEAYQTNCTFLKLWDIWVVLNHLVPVWWELSDAHNRPNTWETSLFYSHVYLYSYTLYHSTVAHDVRLGKID